MNQLELVFLLKALIGFFGCPTIFRWLIKNRWQLPPDMVAEKAALWNHTITEQYGRDCDESQLARKVELAAVNVDRGLYCLLCTDFFYAYLVFTSRPIGEWKGAAILALFCGLATEAVNYFEDHGLPALKYEIGVIVMLFILLPGHHIVRRSRRTR